MRTLVTGATGFLGGAVARRLAAAGHDVLGTGRDAARGAELERDGVRFEQADLADRDAVRGMCRERDWVVHCAALSSPWGPPGDFFRANVVATGHVVAAASQFRVRRLVHISTPSIYMGQGSRRGVREDDALPKPINAYAATKRRAEEIVRAAGLDAVILRPRGLFGPGDTVIFPRIVRALESRRLPVIGDGQNVVDLTYIDNCVDAVELALGAGPAARGLICNITNAEPVRLWDLIFDLARELGLSRPRLRVPRSVAMAMAGADELLARLRPGAREPLMTRYGVSVLADTMTLDVSRAREVLGYQPRVSVREGFSRFIATLRSSP